MNQESTDLRWALGVVDVENDFCEGGSLAVEGGAEVAGKIRQWIELNPRRWVARFATADRHPVGLKGHFAPAGEDPDYAHTWPSHCVAGTWGSELHPNLLENTNESTLFDVLIEKGQHDAAYSGFEGTTPDGDSLSSWLRARGIDGIELTGIATDYCVRETAIDAAREGFKVRVILDLCAGIHPDTITRTITDLTALGVEFTTTDALLAETGR